MIWLQMIPSAILCDS